MEKKEKAYLEEPIGYVHEFLDKPDNVASATEETGLTPTPPMSEEEAQSYADICDMPMQVNHMEKDGKVGKP